MLDTFLLLVNDFVIREVFLSVTQKRLESDCG